MKFDEHARRQSQDLIDALTGHLEKAAGAQFEALRAEVDARAAALKDALSKTSTADHSARLAKLLEELSAVAREEADAIAARARLETEKSAEKKLAAARADAAAQLEALRADTTAQLNAARAEVDVVRAVGAAQVDALRAEGAAQADTLRADAAAQADALRAEADAARAQAASNVEAVRTEATAQVDAARTEAAQHLAGMQREMAALRAECDRQRDSLNRAHGQVQTIEAKHAQLLLLSQDELRKQLKTETQGRSDHASALEAARLEASLARIDAAEQAENLQLAATRIQTLETKLTESDADNGAQLQRRTDEDRHAGLLLMDTLRSAMQAIQRATTPNDILEILLEYLGHHFDGAAAFLVVGSGFKGWQARRLGATTDLNGTAMADAIVPLLTRIAAGREPLALAATDDAPLIGLAGRPVANAVALPLCVDGLVLAIVYAEDASSDGASGSVVGLKAAEMLVEQATRRLTKRPAATDRTGPRQKAGPVSVERPKGQPYSSPRQARRVKMQKNVDVTLDGSASFLIDISSLGAQVLSPLALHPNRLVQMQLVGGETVIECKGCVIWALFEHPQGTNAALYRAGIRFTEVDLPAVDSFLAVQGVPPDVSLSQDALNMFGARDNGALRLHHGAKKSTAS